MKRFAIGAVLGLSIIGSVLATPQTAHAYRLRNYKNFSLFLGVSRGTPTNGTPFIVWTEDHSANQSFVGSRSSVSPNAEVLLRDEVAQYAIADVVGYTPYRQPVVVGYPIDYMDGSPVYAQKSYWIVDNSIPMTYTEYKDGRFTYYQCYRFKNSVRQDQVIGVSGGNPRAGSAVIVWDKYDYNYLDHLDQFWCPVD